MQGGERRSIATRAYTVARYTASILLIAGVVLDTAGLAFHSIALWAAGAHLITAAIAFAFIAVIAGASAANRRRRFAIRATAALFAVLVLALARWVRGHPEVQPDPPIFAAEVLAAIALLMLLRRGGNRREAEPLEL